MNNFDSEIGKRYGHVVVVYKAQDKRSKEGYWVKRYLIQCDCGSPLREVDLYRLKRKNRSVKSCGCSKFRLGVCIGDRTRKHGMTNTSEYISWQHLKSRFLDEKSDSYYLYGGAGVPIDKRFLESFEFFISVLGRKPDDGQRYTVGRICNRLGYTIGNLRWETGKQQARNQARNTRNKTGKTGVHWMIQRSDYKYAVVTWRSLDGKACTKRFSVLQLGEDEAFKQACEYRDKIIEEMNEQGAEYSPDHGKETLKDRKYEKISVVQEN